MQRIVHKAFDAIGVDELRQSYRTLEASVHALGSEDPNLALRLRIEHRRLGATNGENVLLEADVHLLGAHAR